MAKFTLEQKIDAVYRYQNGSESVYSISESMNANRELIGATGIATASIAFMPL